ncbi:MAG TPA: hypothetical protein EYQ78_07710 [Candidatus Poseidoniales archaeon]|nr:hypothetical protein [Candidatus Poseidoniales archaeon]
MPDAWELEYGLNRTSSVIPGSSVPEQSHDFDGDGLDNLQEMGVSADPNNPDTDGDCIRDIDELVFATLKQIPASDAILFADADNDGVADGEQTDCGSNMIGSGDGNNDSTNNDNTTSPTIPEAENPFDSPAAKALIGVVGIAMVALVIALVAILLGGRETARGVVKDDSFDLAIAVAQEAAFGSEESGSEVQSDTLETEVSETLTPDGSLTEEPKILSSRDDAVGRHDGVHGAPLLDGFEFEGWSPQKVQDALNSGQTIDQLREQHKKENSE